MDPTNEFLVTTMGDELVVLNLNPLTKPISKERALMLAAWIVSLVDLDDDFPKYLQAVQNT